MHVCLFSKRKGIGMERRGKSLPVVHSTFAAARNILASEKQEEKNPKTQKKPTQNITYIQEWKECMNVCDPAG